MARTKPTSRRHAFYVAGKNQISQWDSSLVCCKHGETRITAGSGRFYPNVYNRKRGYSDFHKCRDLRQSEPMKATNNREEDGDKRQNDADAKETKNTSSTHAKTFLDTPPQSSPCQAVVSLSVPARETSSRTSRQPHEAIFPMKLMSNKHRRRHSYKNTGQYSYQHPKTTAMLTVPEILSYPRRLQERRRLQILCITPLVQSESLLEKTNCYYKMPNPSRWCEYCLGNDGARYLGCPSHQGSRETMKLAIKDNLQGGRKQGGSMRPLIA